jgi:N-acetylmuramoyl-L-alanine amidase
MTDRPAGSWRARRVRQLAVIAAGLMAAGLAGSACGVASAGSPASQPAVHPPASPSADQPAASPPASPPPASPPPAIAAKPLAGQVIGIDPGHNGRNWTDPGYVDRLIWNGREWEDCDTTGTQTDGGYTEAQFNFNVASYLRDDLIRDGARVVMTRTNNDGVGPCVNTRSEIINRAHADVAVDIHADGGPASGRGFAILEPVSDGPNDGVIASSERFGGDLRQALLADVPQMPESSYDGVDGIDHRDNLAGLNLTTVPKVLIECGNMRNATDARLLVSASFQRQLAGAIAAAIISFLGRG